MPRSTATRLLLVCLLFLGLPGCSGEDPRVGSWTLDLESTKADLETAEGEDAMKAMMIGMLENVEMNLEVRADGTFTAQMKGMGQEETTTGTWTATENGLVMTDEKTGTPMTATFRDDDHLVAQEESTTMVFKRKPAV